MQASTLTTGYTRETLISLLSHKPRLASPTAVAIVGPTISDEPVNKSPEIRWSRVRRLQLRLSRPSLGLFDRLPTEIFFYIFGMLGLQSMSKFARLSRQTYTLVHSNAAYRDLAARARQPLKVLIAVGIIDQTPVAALHAGLTSTSCYGCGKTVSILFLPSAERYCWRCLGFKPSLRLVLPEEASMWIGPDGQYAPQPSVLYMVSGQHNIYEKLVPDLAQQVQIPTISNSSEKGLKHLTKRLTKKIPACLRKSKPTIPTTRNSTTKITTTTASTTKPPAFLASSDLMLCRFPPAITGYTFDGLSVQAYTPVAGWPKARSESTAHLMCRGCENTYRSWLDREAPEMMQSMSMAYRDPHTYWLHAAAMGRGEKAFLRHVEGCSGAQKILEEAAKERLDE